MGLPIMVQLTESERNKLHPGDGLACCILSTFFAHFSLQQHQFTSWSQCIISWEYAVSNYPFMHVTYILPDPIVILSSIRIYVGSLHFNLTESDIKQVFEPFGELDFVDLHRDPMTGRSKGFCFIQYVAC